MGHGIHCLPLAVSAVVSYKTGTCEWRAGVVLHWQSWAVDRTWVRVWRKLHVTNSNDPVKSVSFYQPVFECPHIHFSIYLCICIACDTTQSSSLWETTIPSGKTLQSKAIHTHTQEQLFSVFPPPPTPRYMLCISNHCGWLSLTPTVRHTHSLTDTSWNICCWPQTLMTFRSTRNKLIFTQTVQLLY